MNYSYSPSFSSWCYLCNYLRSLTFSEIWKVKLSFKAVAFSFSKRNCFVYLSLSSYLTRLTICLNSDFWRSDTSDMSCWFEIWLFNFSISFLESSKSDKSLCLSSLVSDICTSCLIYLSAKSVNCSLILLPCYLISSFALLVYNFTNYPSYTISYFKNAISLIDIVFNLLIICSCAFLTFLISIIFFYSDFKSLSSYNWF